MQDYVLDKAPLAFLLAEMKFALLRINIEGVENVDLLDLADGSLTALSLEGRIKSGPQIIFKGHLGPLKTQKAFKITRVPDEDYALF